jgi:hypothetical protein
MCDCRSRISSSLRLALSRILRKMPAMSAMTAGEAPFAPEYCDDVTDYEEPPFMKEWSEANTGVQIVGQTCVSMLSEALKLYLQTWESELGVKWENGERKRYFKDGFVRGYQRCFGELLKLNWSECPADFDLLEQITLARNAAQHPDHIANIEAQHDLRTRSQFPSPFFIHDSERHLVSADNPLSSWFSPNIHVSMDKMLSAIGQVEALANWLEDRMFAAKFPQR